ncbi:MAG: LysM peptidoglycan-binding domain-containing protein [Saprospiraceae bacterium]|nr:LysM peptidoglycan-binding domain-containing protein [Saprospiraceae bacterium]
MRSYFLSLMLVLTLEGAQGQSNALYLPFRPECVTMLEPNLSNDKEPEFAYLVQTATGRCTLYTTVNIIRTYNPPPASSLCPDFPAAESLCELINGKKRYAYMVHNSNSYSLLVPLGAANTAEQSAASPGFFTGGTTPITNTTQATKAVDRHHDNQFKAQPQTKPVVTPSATVSAREHVVQGGETLSSIARHYGLTPKALTAWNNITNPSLIKPGMVLKLYPPKDQTDKSYNKDDVKVVVLSLNTSENPDTKHVQHVVKDGETIVSVANHYKISAQLLAEVNRISINEPLIAGQILQLPLN